MKYEYISEKASIKKISEDDREGVFEIEGLYTGYGVTIGNSLRRVLLSSLPGAAITQIKVKNVNHEFTSLPGVSEDIVEIMLNLKRIRFRSHTFEPQTLLLEYKGEGDVKASDIKVNSEVEIITPEAHIATLTDKSAEIKLELTVEKGLGYVSLESKKTEKTPIGVIALDALFSPVVKVNFTVENMRVDDRTDYDKLRINIETDTSITPSQALRKASKILQDYFEKVSSIEVTEPEPKSEVKPKAQKKTSAKTKKKDEE